MNKTRSRTESSPQMQISRKCKCLNFQSDNPILLIDRDWKNEMAWNAKIEKATSELLVGPDWTLNLSICDSINTYPWVAKDYVKALKKRLKNRHPKVQYLALTILETMVKNCGDCVHAQMIQRDVLGRMLKIIRLHMNVRARDKALSLIDTWQEAFGGRRGKYPQYYWAYDELRRSGVQFPPRTKDDSPIITPPAKLLPRGYFDEGSSSSTASSSSNDPMTSDTVQGLSLSAIESMQTVMELLSDMLQAVNPKDCELLQAVKDEVIVDLVNQCRSNQKKLVELLTSSGDEKLLGPGVQLNESLQRLLAKHDAIALGRPLPVEVKDSRCRPTEVRASYLEPTEVKGSCPRSTETKESSLKSNNTTTALVPVNQYEEEKEEDEALVQLIPRHSRDAPVCSKCTCQMDPAAAVSTPTNALVPSSPTTPVTSTNNQPDLIDLMSLTLSTTSISPTSSASPTSSNSTSPTLSTTSPRTPLELSPCNQVVHQLPITPATHGYLPGPGPHSYLENQGVMSYSSYVVPWVQPHSHPQPQYPQYSSACSSTPWTMTQMNTPQDPFTMTTPHASLTPYPNASASYMPMTAAIPPEYCSTLPSVGTNGSAMYQETKASMVMRTANPPTGQKQFVPSYKLFEDLNVLGVADGRGKSTSNASPGWSNQPMVGGRK